MASALAALACLFARDSGGIVSSTRRSPYVGAQCSTHTARHQRPYPCAPSREAPGGALLRRFAQLVQRKDQLASSIHALSPEGTALRTVPWGTQCNDHQELHQ